MKSSVQWLLSNQGACCRTSDWCDCHRTNDLLLFTQFIIIVLYYYHFMIIINIIIDTNIIIIRLL
jgi:hypothetical protein